jgi:hypothetical protein
MDMAVMRSTCKRTRLRLAIRRGHWALSADEHGEILEQISFERSALARDHILCLQAMLWTTRASGISATDPGTAPGGGFRRVGSRPTVCRWCGTVPTERVDLVDGRAVDLLAMYNEGQPESDAERGCRPDVGIESRSRTDRALMCRPRPRAGAGGFGTANVAAPGVCRGWIPDRKLAGMSRSGITWPLLLSLPAG